MQHVVEYTFKNKMFKETVIGSESEIRNKFIKDNKTIIRISKENILFRRRVNKEEIIIFFTALGDMLAAKQKMSESFEIIIRSINSKSAIIPILRDISSNVAKGKHLSKCLEPYIHIFGTTTISMIEAGEKAGRLSETLRTVVKHEIVMDTVKKNIIKQLMSPCFTLLFGMVGFISATQIIIPQLVDIQKKMGGEKLDNNICITVLTSVSWVTPFIVAALLACVVFAVFYYKNNQEEAEKAIIKVPLIRAVIFYRAYYVAFSGLSNMLSVGMRLQQALPIIAKSTKVIIIRKEFEEASKLIQKGKNFADALLNLTDIERSGLSTAQKEDRIESVIEVVANRFYRLYINKIESVAPKLKYFVIGFIVLLVLLMFFGIFTPYLVMLETMK